ncbi:hypothetical protein SAMN04488564_102938 [Lentzea waywayandensis]|uniref:Uncharacterized protein n=1 Tax=Lentzea waywayandensis TaxID=84724 RepID=A0A1I6DKM8_9PSEU|nr:hypothetical protein SAMN04488564_102938 [Lentzea waywayandensis]
MRRRIAEPAAGLTASRFAIRRRIAELAAGLTTSRFATRPTPPCGAGRGLIATRFAIRRRIAELAAGLTATQFATSRQRLSALPLSESCTTCAPALPEPLRTPSSLPLWALRIL